MHLGFGPKDEKMTLRTKFSSLIFGGVFHGAGLKQEEIFFFVRTTHCVIQIKKHVSYIIICR